MAEKHQIGLIGAGMIAERHIDNLHKTGRAQVRWVVDREVDKAQKVKEKYGVTNAGTDYHDILRDEAVDAVVIATPPQIHFQMFKDAVAAGKHILVEKPLSIKPQDLDEMVALEKAHPELIISGCSARHARLQPKYAFVKEIIDSGALGEIYYIHHNSVARQSRGGVEYHPTAKWFLNKAIAGGGPLLDWGVYDLSYHLGLLNDEPELLDVKTLFLKLNLDAVDKGTDIADVEEHGASLMTFSGGLTYYWERASHANMDIPNETRIYGTKAGLRFAFCSWDTPIVELFDVENEGRGQARKQVLEVDMANHPGDEYMLAEHYVNVLSGKEKVEMPIALAKKHLDIIFKVYSDAQ